MNATKVCTDPIFEAVEAHRAAVHAMLAASDISARLENNDDPGFEAADRVAARTSEREMKALRALLGCRPTTLVGAIALLDHLGRPYTLRDIELDSDTALCLAHQWSKNKDEVITFPHMLADALRSLVGSTTSIA
jgi:hypothetical protein